MLRKYPTSKQEMTSTLNSRCAHISMRSLVTELEANKCSHISSIWQRGDIESQDKPRPEVKRFPKPGGHATKLLNRRSVMLPGSNRNLSDQPICSEFELTGQNVFSLFDGPGIQIWSEAVLFQ